MSPKYRADIDGLRALAVLSVIFFHSGVTFFTGGYVGVDIFFVISGYLITIVITTEIDSNSFSIAKFYERRFRRILPALTTVIISSLAVGIWLLTPSHLINLGKSTIFTSLFSSNILFYLQSGYFDKPAELKPLLHTWSLAVEEQYYIFFPLLLVFIAKFNAKHYLKCLVAIGMISLIACVILTKTDSSWAFYLFPARAWELLIGSILGLHVLPTTPPKYVRETLSVIGIFLIAYSITLYTPETDFPGIAAITPTLGAALLIYSGICGKTFVARILSMRPIVFIGLISYSLYLWHWPIIVFTKIYHITQPSITEIIFMLMLTFFFSVLSWRYIETPFRKKSLLKNRRSLLCAASIVSLFITGSGYALVLNNGIPQRSKGYIDLGTDATDYEWKHWAACERVEKRIKRGQKMCNIGNSSSSDASFIVWGDSHARALASGIDLSAKSHNVKGVIATQSGCPPLLSIERPNRTTCDKFNKVVLKYISETPEIKSVILAARWAISTTGTRYKNEPGKSVKLTDLESTNNDNISNNELFKIGLKRTIDELHRLGKKVVLVNPIPEIGFDVPSANFVAEMSKRDINSIISPSVNEYRERTAEVSIAFKEINNNFSIQIVSPAEHIINEDYCMVVVDGIPLYRDDDHLSTYGSKYISSSFDAVFKKNSQYQP